MKKIMVSKNKTRAICQGIFTVPRGAAPGEYPDPKIHEHEGLAERREGLEDVRRSDLHGVRYAFVCLSQSP